MITITDLSVIQNWLNNPAQNGGFLLYSPNMEASFYQMRFYPSENETLANQPQFEIRWIPEPSVASLIGFGLLLVWRRRSVGVRD